MLPVVYKQKLMEVILTVRESMSTDLTALPSFYFVSVFYRAPYPLPTPPLMAQKLQLRRTYIHFILIYGYKADNHASFDLTNNCDKMTNGNRQGILIGS